VDSTFSPQHWTKQERVMKIGKAIMTAAVAAGITAAGLVGAENASATTAYAQFGTWQRLRDANGAVITAWNVHDLRPSSELASGYPLAGTLWEATVGVTPIRGTSTPIIPNLNARTDSEQNYQVLWQLVTPGGLSGATINKGDKSKGKVYFDVTGSPPTEVVYNNGAEDLMVWES
jgi:hypothetical protein